jgi:hypothetical protein
MNGRVNGGVEVHESIGAGSMRHPETRHFAGRFRLDTQYRKWQEEKANRVSGWLFGLACSEPLLSDSGVRH